MAKQDRINELLNTVNFPDYDPEQNCTQEFEFRTCRDLLLTCVNDCVDLVCDCCGDIEVTDDYETSIRIITGTNSSNWMGIPGLDWQEYENANLNSLSKLRIQNEISQIFQNENIEVEVTVEYENRCFLITIFFPTFNQTICFRTESGSLIEFRQ